MALDTCEVEAAILAQREVSGCGFRPPLRIIAGLMRLVLASASPRRRELLAKAGVEFEVLPSSLDEAPHAGESPEDYARRVARDKALDAAANLAPDCVVLGADTIVVTGEEILGKPRDTADAARMIRILSGVTHRVITGVCLARPPAEILALTHETTTVTFRALDEKEIADYVASGEALDKAGAYGIQGLASKFVTRIEGCYFNVVGLPVSLVCALLKSSGREL
jgi:septum formation protein